MDASLEGLALLLEDEKGVFMRNGIKYCIVILVHIMAAFVVNAQATTATIKVSGRYTGKDFEGKNRIIIQSGATLNDIKLNGYVLIDTDEKVILRNCDIYADGGNERDYQICINKVNSKIELVNCKIHCDNYSVRYGVYAPHQIKSLVIKNCEFYGLSEMAINCTNRILKANIEANTIHDIGTYSLSNGAYHRNATGIRINENLSDTNPDYSLYGGMSILIKNNVIRDLRSYYAEDNDVIESHGIIVYGNNVIIAHNTIENLLAGTSSKDLSMYCGSEHEGIYVKGDNCIISNNILKNACGNVGSEGAIAVKWNGRGGKIVNNEIYQCFGNGIWSQCRGVDISNNRIHYTTSPLLNDKKVDRYYGIYNYVVTKDFIPIHKARKYVNNITQNEISFEGVDNLKGFVISIDNNIDDINICGNLITVNGFVQLFRLVEQGAGKNIKRSVTIKKNIIDKPYPVRNDDFVQQDFMIACGNDGASTFNLTISNNEFKYKRGEEQYKHIGYVLRNYRCDENIRILMKNNILLLPQYIDQTFFRVEDGVRLLDISNNIININLRRLVDVCNTDRDCDITIKNNQFGASIGVVQLLGDAKVKNLKFNNNEGRQGVQVTVLPTSGSIESGCSVGDLYVKGNSFKSMIISMGEEYKTLLKGNELIKNNH